MKKFVIFTFIIGAALLFGLIAVAKAQQDIPLVKGMRSEEIKAVQRILKKDPTIYPEGYTTGFFGHLTEKAVKRLQKKFELPETGIIDEPTRKIIFPVFKVKVISPNGGEIWNRNEIQTIKWDIASINGEEIKEEKYFRPKASIDLFRKIEIPVTSPENKEEKMITKSVFVKHIATVNLFDRAYSWKITRDIKNGKDYVIRISVGRKIVPIILEKPVIEPEEIWPIMPKPTWINWDESDETFEITGVIPPTPTPDLERVIAILEKIMTELQKAISLLKEMAR